MGNSEYVKKIFEGKIPIDASNSIIKQLFGEIPTYCGKCGKKITFKLLYFSRKNPLGKNYTKKCGCGIEINYYNEADKYHETEYFVQVFRSKYQEKEKNYEKKVFKNGKTKYIKSS